MAPNLLLKKSVCEGAYVCVGVAGTRKQSSILFSLVSYTSLCREQAWSRVLSQSHGLHGSDTRAQVLLQVIEQVQFVVLPRLRDPDAVSLLRVDLKCEIKS